MTIKSHTLNNSISQKNIIICIKDKLIANIKNNKSWKWEKLQSNRTDFTLIEPITFDEFKAIAHCPTLYKEYSPSPPPSPHPKKKVFKGKFPQMDF